MLNLACGADGFKGRGDRRGGRWRVGFGDIARGLTTACNEHGGVKFEIAESDLAELDM